MADVPFQPLASVDALRVRTADGLLAVVLAVGGAGGMAVTVELLSPRSAPVWRPLLAASFVLLAFFVWLKRGREGSAVVFEIGFVYAAAVWVYVCYPLAGYLVNGLQYGPLNDIRLQLAAPAPADVGRIGWMYVVHLVGFVAAYSWFHSPGVASAPPMIGKVEGLFLLLLVAVTQGWSLFLGWSYQWAFTTNLDRYVAFANLPRLTAQIAGHVDGIRLTSEIAFLAFLFQRYARYRIWIFGWLAAISVKTFVDRQSRTELVLLIFASVMLYGSLVRRIRVSHLVVLAFAGLAVFNFLGVRRMEAEGVSEIPRLRRLFVANEFETLFANAYDLDARVRSGTLEPPPRGIRATDLIAVVPQQLLSWQKIAPADWYVRTMYPDAAEAGVGFCFGTVSESIVSSGWPDLLGRGAFLGLLLGFLQRCVQRRGASSFWWFVFGVWLSVLIYHSVRNTTFAFVAMAWYRFIPVVVAVSAGSWLVRTALGRNTAARSG